MKFWILYDSVHYELDLDLFDPIEILKSKIFLMLPFKIPPDDQILKDSQTGWILKDDKELSHYYLSPEYTGSPPYIIEIEKKLATTQIYSNVRNQSMCYESSEDKEKEENSYLNVIKEYQQVLEDKNSLELNLEILKEEEVLKTLQIDSLQKENSKLQAKIDLLNETIEALPKRLEADIGVQDSRVDELEYQILILKEQIYSQERKFHSDLQNLGKIIESKDEKIKDLTAKIEETKANLLSMANVVKKQEVEGVRVKNLYDEKIKEYRGRIKTMKDFQEKLLTQTNSLKTKWRTEARRIFHESMSYIQKNYKQMLTIEELGFLKPSDNFTDLTTNINSAEDMASIVTSSTNYEEIDACSTQDLSGLGLLKNSEDKNQNMTEGLDQFLDLRQSSINSVHFGSAEFGSRTGSTRIKPIPVEGLSMLVPAKSEPTLRPSGLESKLESGEFEP